MLLILQLGMFHIILLCLQAPSFYAWSLATLEGKPRLLMFIGKFSNPFGQLKLALALKFYGLYTFELLSIH